MKSADRIGKLGTETAFAVSAEARAWASQGNKVYPFHLGDINIRTPDNIIAAAHKAMLDGKTGYVANGGIIELKEALAADINATHGTHYSAAHVAVQPGGKPVIGKFILALMNPGDEVLYPNPGFPIYESQIEFNGGKCVPYGFLPGKENFGLDMAALEKAVTPKTRLLIVNDLQNPTGAESSETELKAIAAFAVKHNLFVLCDEAYFDLRFSGKSRTLLAYPGMVERTIILYTFSKKYAMTGWRLGAAIGPQDIIDVIVKLNLNDESCTAHFIQLAGVEALNGDQSGSQKIIGILKERRDVATDILNSIPGVKCFRPNATFYLYPDVTGLMAAKGFADDYDGFRKDVLHKTGVSFCTRLHFGRALPGESSRYVRLAYSGIDLDMIKEGLGKFTDYAKK
ncbi:MAG: aminotransferase class I/II-fold pyridoxal phosphate-dependent enzyme [Treponemataceae bacterium]